MCGLEHSVCSKSKSKVLKGKLRLPNCMQGFAFAEYFDVATAQSAQRHLNGTELGGRPLRIDFADTESELPTNFQVSEQEAIYLNLEVI